MRYRSRSPRALPAILAGVVLGLLAGGGFAPAHADCPGPGTILLPGVEGEALQHSLRAGYRPPVGLSYGDARDVMFSDIDNHGGMVSGIYTSYSVFVDPGSLDPRGDAFAAGVNTEHTWPQSKGAGQVPARADLHHLFPSEIDANGARAAHPFAEIPDDETDLWYRLLQVTSNPNPDWLNEYSELDNRHPDPAYVGRWEPREERKGDVARAMFYFYTMYRAEADAADAEFFDVQKDDLRAWHQADPVSEEEWERTCAIAPHQDDKVNPFIIDATLVDRAYFGGVPVQLASFRAAAIADGVRLTWETISEHEHAGFHVLRADGKGETRLTTHLITTHLITADPGRRVYAYRDAAGEPGAVYDYWLEAVGRDGGRERFGPRRARFPEPVPVFSAHPNPARGGEAVRFETPGPAAVELFDLAGRRVRRLEAEVARARGWDGRLESGASAPPGVYFARVLTDHGAITLRLVRLR